MIVFCDHGPFHTLNPNGASGGGGGNRKRWYEKEIEIRRNEDGGRQTHTVNINASNGDGGGNSSDSGFAAFASQKSNNNSNTCYRTTRFNSLSPNI